MKKLTSLILALAMCLALAIPAFATQEGEMSTEIESQLPTLDITFPSTSTIILNPYRMKYSGTGTPPTGIEATDRFQIMNAVFSVESKTFSSVEVKATFTGETEGDATLVAAPVLPGDTGKNVHLQMTYATASAAAAAVPADGSPVETISDNELELKWTLPPASKSGNTTVPQRIDMQFSGTCSDAPEESPWSNSDTVGCSIVFEAIPVTDIPLIAKTYQLAAGASPTTADIIIDTGEPADYKTGGAVTKIEHGALTAANNTLTDAKDGTTVTALTSTWTGKKLTIKGADLATTLTAAGKKKVLVTMTYTSSETGNPTKTLQYELKVTVLAAPQQQNP